MSATGIEYLRGADGSPGMSWNPITGCTNTLPCREYCWARKMSLRQAGRNGYDATEPFRPTFHADKLLEPMRHRKPRRIAVNFMGDTFCEGVPDERIDTTFAVMALCPQHTFLVLTKRPNRMAKYLSGRALQRIIDQANRLDDEHGGTLHAAGQTGIDWPPLNVWFGTSIANQRDADERYEHLRNCPGNLWYSIEPMSGPIDRLPLESISWVVLGGGPFPVHTDWVRSVRNQCLAAGVPFFFKQWGEWYPYCDESGHYINAYVATSPPSYYFDDGRVLQGKYQQHASHGWESIRVGKKNAGRLLDGREWNEIPEVTQ